MGCKVVYVVLTKLGSWRGIHRLCFFVATFALLLCTTTLFRLRLSLYSFNSDTPFILTNQTHVRLTLDTLIRKIQQQLDQTRDSQNVSFSSSKHASFLADILGLVESVHTSLTLAVADTHPHPNPDLLNHLNEEYFLTEEIRKYIRMKPNRLGKQNFMGANGTFTSIGHACFSLKKELEMYMDYDVGDICNDDWKLAQKLMVHGCDPLPRRRCFAKAPQFYTKPLPMKESLWALPDDGNVRWSQYRCKNFTCLVSNATATNKKGFFKCADCFNLIDHEKGRWMGQDPDKNASSEFTISEVVDLKGDEMRIGLDFSVGTGSFAARMREHNVTIVSASINLGAPFSEFMALRGVIPLYMTVNQRVPFFDNTLDLIHTTGFLDGWIDLVMLEFVLYDWDRVLRPGGLLWIDSFFCMEEELNDYISVFKMLRYRKHKWRVVPKTDKYEDGEVFFSAVLEKPFRPFR